MQRKLRRLNALNDRLLDPSLRDGERTSLHQRYAQLAAEVETSAKVRKGVTGESGNPDDNVVRLRASRLAGAPR